MVLDINGAAISSNYCVPYFNFENNYKMYVPLNIFTDRTSLNIFTDRTKLENVVGDGVYSSKNIV